MRLKTWLDSLLQVLVPRTCTVCGTVLSPSEQWLCGVCLSHLPRTGWKGARNNVLERHFAEVKPGVHEAPAVCRAHALMYYEAASAYSRMLLAIKYYDKPKVAVAWGRMLAADLQGTDFFSGADMLLPVPLSLQRLRQRGYNQSERLAEGIAQLTGLPVNTTAVVRVRHNPSQTHLSQQERHANVQQLFAVRHPEQLQGRHLVLVDDVITYGYTLKSCIQAVLVVCPDVRFSVLSLAASSAYRLKMAPRHVHAWD